MTLFYNIAIHFYRFLIGIASVRNVKAKQWVSGRKNWAEKLQQQIDPNKPVVWFHCASLGEFEQGRPVIEEYKEKEPGSQILLTFFSPSGYELRKNYDKADVVAYMPLDTAANAQRFISIAKPQKVVFVKYEFWYHFLNELNKENIPVMVISAIFRPTQTFFRKWGGWYRRLLKKVDFLFVQDENSKQLLSGIGVNQVAVAGDTRFDRVAQIASSIINLPIVEKFVGANRVVVAGSTWSPDEELIANFINNDTSNTKYIIAPHEIKPKHVDELVAKLEVGVQKYTSLNGVEDVDENAKVLIIDCIGILSSVYSYGHIAYIGGGFGVGIHNTLEPATFGMPVIFGPNHERFREAVMLKESGGGFAIENQEELNSIFLKLINNAGYLSETAEIAGSFVKNNTGATGKIVEKLSGK
ncbi:3-deoxy-D-manno-octulosonic acid transferase [Prolixibacteraceae bacterium JC049]|nr:3-deoxy-D-manno-octulosonic acid transferase [Prolixibacteraceae bacterium JC049]